MMMPPGVVAVAVMFSRNHNYIAEGLFSVNEGGKYKSWAELNTEEKKWSVWSQYHLLDQSDLATVGKMRTYSSSLATSTWDSSPP